MSQQHTHRLNCHFGGRKRAMSNSQRRRGAQHDIIAIEIELGLEGEAVREHR